MTQPRIRDERTFTGSLLRLARVYRREVNRALAAHGMSDARALPVLHLARAGGGMRQGVLAEALGVEGPSLVRILDQLCAAGLVDRRVDPNDGRAKTLHLTADGEAMAKVVEDALQGVRSRVLSGVSDVNLATTLRAFTAFEAALDAAAGQGS
jgi:MarR family transcriptional regulator for hemolysin